MDSAAPDELAVLVADQVRDDSSRHLLPEWHTVPLYGDDVRPRRLLATDPGHGNVWFYVNRRCRCGKCKRAIADYRQARRVAGKEPWK